MENNDFKIIGDLDFNDISLNISPKKEQTDDLRVEDKDSPFLPYKSIIEKKTEEQEMFKSLLDEIQPIDFLRETIGENNLREELNNATDSKTKEILQRKIEKLMPNNKQKYVIITRRLLEMADRKGYGMGIYNEEFEYYDGRCWVKGDINILISFLGEFAKKCGLSELEALQFKTKEDLLSQFKVDAVIPSTSKNSDILIPFQNVILKFVDGKPEVIDFDKDLFLRYLLPFEYDPKAKCPKFDFYFNKVLPDPSLQNICFEFLGSVYTSMPHEKTLFLLGSGANGKSVFYNVVSSCFGKEQITTIPLEDLCAFQSQSTALLENTLINFCPDIGDRKFDIGLFKRLVSREKIPVKEVYKKVHQMENYGRLAFNCNTLPKEPENTDAFHRRLLIVRFGVTIPEKERDYDLAKKIIANELPGFFNLIIEGLQRLLLQKGFSHSDALEEELKKYRIDSNSVLSFLDEERYVIHPTSKISVDTFYQLYKEYCIKNGFHAYGVKKLNSQLRNAGFKIERSTHGYYHIFCRKVIPDIDNLIDSDGAIIIRPRDQISLDPKG